MRERCGTGGSVSVMRTILIIHDVDDVDHWLHSPRRREIFGPLGIAVRTFVDHAASHRVGLVLDVPSMELYEEAMRSPGAAAAMEYDGVRTETLQVLTEG